MGSRAESREPRCHLMWCSYLCLHDTSHVLLCSSSTVLVSIVHYEASRWRWASLSLPVRLSDKPTSVVMNAICVYNNLSTGLLADRRGAFRSKHSTQIASTAESNRWTPRSTNCQRGSKSIQTVKTVWNVWRRKTLPSARSHSQLFVWFN